MLRRTAPRYLLTTSVAALAITLFSTSAGAVATSDVQPVPATPQQDSPVEPTPTPTDETQQASSTNLSAENAEKPADESAIVVTGSRIRRPDFNTPNPMISIGSDQVERSGTTNLTQFLTGLPALQGSSGSDLNSGNNASIGYTGLNLLNLRNLGVDRTLVLVDGRRHVAAIPGSQAVDINTIPEDLVERVDIQTGGASAIYGADGVSGVVNFVMKRNFEGLTIRAQNGISQLGDAGQRLIAVTAGKNFADGRANIAIALEHGEEDRLNHNDRVRLSGANAVGFYENPDDPENLGGYTGPADNGIPDYVPLNNVRYFDTSRQGGIDVDFDGFPDYVVGSGGQVEPFVGIFNGATYVPSFYQQGGNGTLASDYNADLLPKINRNIVNVLGHFDVSPALSFFAEGKYARTKSFTFSQPTWDYYLLIKPDNPFIPADIAAVAPDGVLLNRDEFDFGQRGEDITRQTWRGVVGARGDLGAHANYEVSYVYGRTKSTNHYVNDILSDRFYAAVDVVNDPSTGQPTCRVNLDPNWTPDQPYTYVRSVISPTTFQPGQCVPLNLFGEGAPSQQALDFITADTTDRSTITQQVLSGSFSGDLGGMFSFPGGGNLGYALGAEYRKETSSFTADPLAQQGLTFGNSLNNDSGKFSVKEVFGEVRAPIFTHRPLADRLEIGAAARFSDYSTIGSTTAWKIDGSYAPVRDITFNATYSKAVRAPNISELFSGQSQTFQFLVPDPCNFNQQTSGSQYRQENCITLLTALGADPTTYEDNRAANLSGVVEGNSTLSEETAKTLTFGVQLQPRFIPGLTARADWYDIKLKNAINTASLQQLAALCVDQPSLDNVFCSLITRQQGDVQNSGADPGNVVGYTLQPFNVSQFRTSGLDINLNYRRNTGFGLFNFNLVGNYLKRLQFVATPGADVTEERLDSSYRSPKFTAKGDLTWTKGKVTLSYGLLYWSKTLRFSPQTYIDQPDYVDPKYKWLKEHWEHSIYAKVQVNQKFNMYGGVNNLWNQKPEIGTQLYPVNSIGRFFFVGVRMDFKPSK
jgi:iron complex outermembrane receptor protein